MTSSFFSSDNHLIIMARQARVRWPRKLDKLYPFVAILVGLFIGVGSTLVFTLFALAIHKTGILDFLLHNENPNVAQASTLIFGFLSMIFLVWLWLWVMERRSLRTIGLQRSGFGRQYVRGVVVGFLLITVIVAMMAITGSARLSSVDLSGAAIAGIAIMFLGWMVQGGAEEILARGFLMPVIGARWGVALGIVLSSLLHAYLHIQNPSVNPLAMSNLILLAIFFSLYALAEESLWGVMGVHAAWNWTQGNIFGVEVSGTTANSTSHLMQWRVAGPDWLTGGGFGPEGSAFTFVILIIGSLLVITFALRRRKQSAP